MKRATNKATTTKATKATARKATAGRKNAKASRKVHTQQPSDLPSRDKATKMLSKENPFRAGTSRAKNFAAAVKAKAKTIADWRAHLTARAVNQLIRHGIIKA